MKKAVWAVIGLGLMIWSALAWFVHSLVGWGGALASGNADIVTPHAETVEWLSWLALFGTDVGQWIVIAVWVLGVLLALVLGFAGNRILPRLGSSIQKLKT
jgi:hypothetical protein